MANAKIVLEPVQGSPEMVVDLKGIRAGTKIVVTEEEAVPLLTMSKEGFLWPYRVSFITHNGEETWLADG